MPLQEIKIISPEASLGIWKTDETLPEIESPFREEIMASKAYIALPTDKRKMEWLTTRLLLKELLQTTNFSLDHHTTGKPFLREDKRAVSISHSENYTAVIISKTTNAGIDIQNLRRDIIKGSHYFLSDKEVKQMEKGDKNLTLHIYWCAKEVLIKYFNASGIDFKNIIYINPFTVKSKGEITGSITIHENQHILAISYETYNEYVLAYAV